MDIQTEKCSQYPLISVIIPVYKVENYIRSCVDSILNQKLANFECILVDDGSPDNCPTICDEYAQNDRRIRVVHQENQGLSAARNAGMRMASGEWLAFVDSDDCVHPDYLSMLYETAQATDADIVCCSFFSIQDQESMDEKWTYSPLKKVLSAQESMHFCFIIKKETFPSMFGISYINVTFLSINCSLLAYIMKISILILMLCIIVKKLHA